MIEIRTAIKSELQPILYVLNEATLNLHSKGIKQWSYPWLERDIEQDLDTGNIYVVINDDNIVGTFTMYEIDSISQLKLPQRSMYLTKIAIHPDFQGMNLGNKITNSACTMVRDLKKTLYLDCWAGNDKLKSFYTKTGFEYLGDIPENDYMISIFKYH